MDYSQILCKKFLKLKVTTKLLVKRQHFLQEIIESLVTKLIHDLFIRSLRKVFIDSQRLFVRNNQQFLYLRIA